MQHEAPRTTENGFIGQIDASVFPRFGGATTFARLPRIDEVDRADVIVVGIPFDAGVSYRPGARFGPNYIRESSRLLRPYNPAQQVSPFALQQVVDAGDIGVNPFNIEEALTQIEAEAKILLATDAQLITLGGDHTIALPLLRAMHAKHGPIAVVHFDAHLDTWDTYFGADYTHGTPFRRASEEGLLAEDSCMHIGIRGPLFSTKDLSDDTALGFTVVHTTDIDKVGVEGIVERLRRRVGDRPLYISIDIDVLDPAFAPGTGTPEAGGFTSRELLAILRGTVGLNLVGADIVEVAPAYDHAQVTGVAASHVTYELLSVLALNRSQQ